MPRIDRLTDLEFTDHWTWQPHWTASRPRVLWYLTFRNAPEVSAAAAPAAGRLRDAGADVIPPRWLHLTLTDVGFADEIDEWSLRAASAAVREALADMAPLQLSLGPVSVVPDAVALDVHPVEPLDRLRTLVREAMAGVGISPPDDIEGDFWPHVSLCYVNNDTDHARLREAVSDADLSIPFVRCDRVTEVLVTRSGGHYHWKVRDEIPLWGAPVQEPVHSGH